MLKPLSKKFIIQHLVFAILISALIPIGFNAFTRPRYKMQKVLTLKAYSLAKEIYSELKIHTCLDSLTVRFTLCPIWSSFGKDVVIIVSGSVESEDAIDLLLFELNKYCHKSDQLKFLGKADEAAKYTPPSRWKPQKKIFVYTDATVRDNDKDK